MIQRGCSPSSQSSDAWSTASCDVGLSTFLFQIPANSGVGAALYGGRWNRIGTEAIYASESRSLPALEILVHFSVLPMDFVLTEIDIPDEIEALHLEDSDLPTDWSRESVIEGTREIGERWIREGRYAILSVPSTIVPVERNFVFNPAHRNFAAIRFSPSSPFRFDSRLK